MTPPRLALFAGLTCAATTAIWAAGDLSLGASGGTAPQQTLGAAARGLWCAQAVGLSILVPWYASTRDWQHVAVSVSVFLLAPLPLTGLAWLGGVASIEKFGLVLAGLAIAALVLWFVVASACRLLEGAVIRRAIIAGVQSFGAASALFAWPI